MLVLARSPQPVPRRVENFQDIQRETKGEFSGLGIVIGVKKSALVILSPMEDSRRVVAPASCRATTSSRSTARMRRRLSLAAGGKNAQGREPARRPHLTLLRPDRQERSAAARSTKSTSRARRSTSPRSRIAHLLPATMTGGQDKIGYVRIEEFAEKTSDELRHTRWPDLERLRHSGPGHRPAQQPRAACSIPPSPCGGKNSCRPTR